MISQSRSGPAASENTEPDPVAPPGGRHAVLHVDQDDSFYFDHPLDHVPGILLVAGLFDLAVTALGELAAPQSSHGVRLSLTFPRFGELTDPITLHCAPDGPGEGEGVRLEAIQRAHAVCRGGMTLHRDRVRPAPVLRHPAAGPPAPAPLVHRTNARTVMVGALTEPEPETFESAVLRSEAFAAGPHRHPVDIIEAARQLCLMLGHVAHDRAHDSRVVWLGLDADLPAALDADLPITLRWARAQAQRSRARYVFDVVVAGTARQVGTVACLMHTVSGQAYQKLRSAGSPA